METELLDEEYDDFDDRWDEPNDDDWDDDFDWQIRRMSYFSKYKLLNEEPKVGDLVRVVDWSYSLNALNLPHKNMNYLPDTTNFVGSIIFKIQEFGNYPSDQSRCHGNGLNTAKIQNIKTGEIFFIDRNFLRVPILFKKF